MDNNSIIIRKGLKLGELDAEADKDLLITCFVDKGDLHRLLDVNDPASIILGRTGSGKSALLYKISADAEHTAFLDPHNISIQFLESSNVIQFFGELGIKLDLFYRILWRHILTVEFIKLRYNLNSESSNRTLLDRIFEFISPDKGKTRAFKYFTEWGDKFWLETDEQLRELTRKFTNDVAANIKSSFRAVDISLQGARSLSDEERTEVRNIATRAVSEIQIQRLSEVLDVLSDFSFNDPQKKYYILIDQLDEDWAATETRCKFIRALVEETKFIRRIQQIKVISALRRDLLELVFDLTRGSGFQEEKYESYLLPLQWSKDDLKALVDLRINEVFRRQYTKENVKFEDVFPAPRKGGGSTAIDYITERTLRRPRDVLQFINVCLMGAADRPRVSWRVILSSESVYSGKRLASLKEEWSEIYPELADTIELLRGVSSPLTRSALMGEKLESAVISLNDGDEKDPCAKIANDYFSLGKGGPSEADVISAMLMCLYHVGAVGIKISSRDTYIWSHVDQPLVTKSEAKRANQILVHKMLHQALEVQNKET